MRPRPLRPRATMSSAPATPARVLVTWDVDGTILTTRGDRANRLHKRAFAAAWRGVLGLDLDIDAVPHQGLTDPLILALVPHKVAGVPLADALARLDELQAEMLAFYRAHAAEAGDGVALLPGVADVLAALAADAGVAQGLTTGNLQPIGEAKMAALGVGHLFDAPPCGGFGSDFCGGAAGVERPHTDRAQLLRIAADRAGSPAARVHVGDTPYDVLAAVDAGASPVAVLTGVHTRADIEAVAPPGTPILESMADVDAALATIYAAAGVAPGEANGR